MSRYRLDAGSVTGLARTALSALLMCHMAARFPTASGYGSHCPRHLMRASWDDAGYCLDAPDVMPAGGCYSLDIPPCEDDPEWPEAIPAPIIAEREVAP